MNGIGVHLSYGVPFLDRSALLTPMDTRIPVIGGKDVNALSSPKDNNSPRSMTSPESDRWKDDRWFFLLERQSGAVSGTPLYDSLQCGQNIDKMRTKIEKVR